MKEILLGQEVKDQVTGFKGIVVSATIFLQGCRRIQVQPKVNKEGTIPESASFDEPDLEVTGNGVWVPPPEPTKEPPPGGPRGISRGIDTGR